MGPALFAWKERISHVQGLFCHPPAGCTANTSCSREATATPKPSRSVTAEDEEQCDTQIIMRRFTFRRKSDEAGKGKPPASAGVSIRHFDCSEAEWRNLIPQKYNPHGGEISGLRVFIEINACPHNSRAVPLEMTR